MFVTGLRREAARAVFESLARGVAFDVDLITTRARRSRRQHLRNGVGALLHATSRVGWRPTPVVALSYLLRENITADIGYGMSELGHAFAPPAVVRRHRSLLVVAPVVAAAAVMIARSRNGASSDETLTVVAVPPQAEPAHAAA